MKPPTRILIVDDEPAILELFTLILQRNGFEIHSATNGQQAREMVAQIRPGLILLDVCLPDANGVELCTEFKTHPLLSDVFIALCSAEARSAAQKATGLDRGADEYLSKPINAEELLARVRNLERLRDTTVALRASAQYCRQLVEMLPDAVIGFDRAGIVRIANARAGQLLDYPRAEDLLGQHLQTFVLPPEQAQLQTLLAAPLEHLPATLEFQLQKKSGRSIPVQLSVAPMAAIPSAAQELVAILRDLTIPQRAEARRAAFARLGQELSAVDTVRGAAQIIVEIADQLLGWEGCQVGLLTPTQGEVITVLSYASAGNQRCELPLDGNAQPLSPLACRVLAEGPLLNNQTLEQATSKTNQDTAKLSNGSQLFALIRKGTTPLGFITIESAQPDAYQPEDLELLQTLGDHCGGALERIRLSESLRESEGRFRSLFEAAPIGLALHDARGHFLNVNAAYLEMLGYSEAELHRRGVKGITVAEDIPVGQQFYAELCAGTRNYYRRQKRYYHRDGRVIWADATAAAVRDAAGHLRFIVSMVDDITERKQAEAAIRHLTDTLEQRVRARTEELQNLNRALRQSEQQLRLTLEASQAGIWSWHALTNESTWDARYHELYGFPATMPPSFAAWIERVHEADRPRLLERIAALQQSSQDNLWNEEFRALIPGRGERWMAGMGQVIRDASGQLIQMLGINLDITPRKRAEAEVQQLNALLEQRVLERTATLEATNQALRASETHKRAIMESALDAIISTDATGTIFETNPATERMFGHNRRQLQGQNLITALISPGLRDWLQNGFRSRFAGENGPQLDTVVEMNALRAGGLIFPAEFIITRIDVAASRPLAEYTVFIRDITEKRRHEEQIRLLADAVESTQELVSVADADFRLTFVNRAFQETYGYSAEEILGQTAARLYPPSQTEVCAAINQETRHGGWQGETQHRRKDGTEFPVALSTSLIHSPSGEIVGFVGVARDISERKRIEKQNTAFSLLSQRLNGVTTATAAAEVITDIASILFQWDAAYIHIHHPHDSLVTPILTMDTLNGRRQPVPPSRAILEPSPLMKTVMQNGARLINRPEADAAVPMVSFGDTQRRSASLMYAPIHSSNVAVGIMSLQSYTPQAFSPRDLHLLQILANHCGDALHRIEVTEALRAAEAKYRSIFENATEGIFQSTPEGRYLSANPAQARMLGYNSPAELIQSISNIEEQTYVSRTQRAELKLLLETQDQVHGFETERWRKDGSRIWTSINGRAVRDIHGKVQYYECTSLDITQRRQAELELRRLSHLLLEAQEVERQRVARELHDGVNQLLASTKMRLSKVRERASKLSAAHREILSRCEQLLGLALDENRRIAHNLRPSDLDYLGLATTCRNFCRELATQSNLAVTCRITGFKQRLPATMELNLFRILQEATNNIQNHAEARTIAVSLAVRGQHVLLKIRDDGVGFDPAKLRSERKGRRGAGLSNIQERASALGGECEVVSAPRRGTSIVVRVPLAPPSAA